MFVTPSKSNSAAGEFFQSMSQNYCFWVFQHPICLRNVHTLQFYNPTPTPLQKKWGGVATLPPPQPHCGSTPAVQVFRVSVFGCVIGVY